MQGGPQALSSWSQSLRSSQPTRRHLWPHRADVRPDPIALDFVYVRTYTGNVDVEWDHTKARTNFTKHGVDFADAAVALEDEWALTMPDMASDDEERSVSLCMGPAGEVLVVVYTWRGDRVRIISARKATPRERAQYAG